MRTFTIALALFLLLVTMNTGLGSQVSLDITHVDGSNTTSVPSPVPSISLPEAANNSSSPEPKMKSESAENEDFIRSEVSAGNKLFVRSIIDDVYSGFNGSVYNALTFVPNPYQDEGIVKLYGGYLNISIYMVLLFIFGTLITRSLARMKLTVGKVNLSQSAFIGGIALCGFALVANVLFSGALGLIAALNQFITLPAMPEIVPNPDNLLLFALKGLCDLVLLGFFVIRYYVIYITAVVCSAIAVLLVPEFTRDFARDCIEKIARILFLQPAALFVYVVCLIASEGLPEILKPFSYIGMTVLVAATCWYFLFGNFTLLKKSVSFAIRKGVVKV